MDMDDGLSRWLLSRGPDCIDARALPDGAAFGPFRILGRIGRGGSADVFRARRESDGAVVAVKVPRRPDAVAAERFRREAALLSAHPHPALPALLDSGEAVRPGLPGKNGADGARLPFLALEELVPLDLPRSSAGVARFLEALCGGVAHLHALGFVHRDIKPSNVMRRPGSESPVLIDFGLVKEAAAAPGPAELGSVPLSVESGHAVVRGTPGYAAPEQFAGAGASPAADVYALGMIALRCFGGRPPLSWRRVLRRATAPLPEARYRDAEAFARAVRHRRRPFLAAAGLAAATALCFAAAVRAAVSERRARVRTGESAVSVLADLLSSANPETGGGRSSATVVSAVEKAVPSIRAEKDPSLRSALALEAGRLFEGVGRFAEAESLYGTAVEALRASGAPDAELAGALHRRGVARRRRDDLAGAETDLREALALRRALAARAPEARPELAATLSALGGACSFGGKAEESLALFLEAADLRRALSREDPGTWLRPFARSMSNLGVQLRDMERFGEAVAAHDEAVAAFRTLARSGASGAREDLARALGFRANALRGAGRFDEARADFAEATAEIRRMAEDEPGAYALSLGTVLGNAAALDAETGRPESARALAEEALSVLEAREREEPGSCAQPLGQIRILLEKLGAPAAGTRR